VDGENYTFFSLLDITDEKRRRWLERIFFHDVMNSVSAVLAAAELVKEAKLGDKDKMAEIILSAGNRIVEEINTQKDLSAAEAGELTVKTEPVNSVAILKEMVALYENSELAKGKVLEIPPDAEPIDFVGDRRLLFRVLGNMVKNALEASSYGDRITLAVIRAGDTVRFSVNNPAVMPENISLQVFQRSFSTKSGDRGLGTYSMKLLSERYMKGRVFFSSVEKEGTTFFAEYPLSPD
jgi:signal transduction histidine kinase